MMDRFKHTVLLLIGGALLLFADPDSSAQPQGRLGFGLRAGPATYTQDITELSFIDGNLGPTLDFEILYEINEYVTLGFDLGWESHNVDLRLPAKDVSLGRITTISLLPCVEFHILGGQTVSPYMFFGLGYSMNAFGTSDDSGAISPYLDLGVRSSKDLGVEDAFSFKIGIGADFFVADTFALNLDLGWKYNPGDLSVRLNKYQTASFSTDESVLTALFGFRLLFPL